MVSVVNAHFKRQGWTARPAGSAHVDLVVGASVFEFAVFCVDPGMRNFHDGSTIVSILYTNTIRMRQIKKFLVNIFDDSYTELDRDHLADRGISVFLMNEIAMISGILRYNDLLPTAPTRREMVLLDRNIKFCLEATDRFATSGDTALAVAWAERAVASTPEAVQGHIKLLRLLIDTDDRAAARSVGERGLSYHPQNVTLLTLMRKLARRTDDRASLAEYERRIEVVNRANAGTIGQLRRGTALPAAAAAAAPGPEPEPEPEPRGVMRWMASLRKPGK